MHDWNLKGCPELDAAGLGLLEEYTLKCFQISYFDCLPLFFVLL